MSAILAFLGVLGILVCVGVGPGDSGVLGESR